MMNKQAYMKMMSQTLCKKASPGFYDAFKNWIKNKNWTKNMILGKPGTKPAYAQDNTPVDPYSLTSAPNEPAGVGAYTYGQYTSGVPYVTDKNRYQHQPGVAAAAEVLQHAVDTGKIKVPTYQDWLKNVGNSIMR